MGKPKILVVEDNPVEQRVIGLLALRYGVEADIATTGYKALQLLADTSDSPYAAVLMNFMLPAMSGVECTQKIREHERGSRSRVPIIAVTAAVSDTARDQCMEVGMDDYLAKPYSLEDFGELMQRWVLNSMTSSS
jgi:CheY-like chemotaxis protein